jgi:hypothetical protein
MERKAGELMGLGYSACHAHLRRIRGKANHCEVCGSWEPGKKYEWANLTGNYEDPRDYKQMCVPCHKRHDVPYEKRVAISNHANAICAAKRAQGLVRRKTHCINGHEFTQENTLIRGYDGYRECLTCKRKHGRDWWRKQRNEAAESLADA